MSAVARRHRAILPLGGGRFLLRQGNFVASLAMAKLPLRDEAEIEIVCPHCGYHMTRTAGRLRRDTKVVCPNCGGDVVHVDKPDEG
jgi:predicted RNA-binding Zn-ribbon protein involved in translation (DUF1610 family)